MRSFRDELVRIGALQRLQSLNRERNILLKILHMKDDSDEKKAEKIVREVKKKKSRKWSPEQHAKFQSTIKKKFAKE
jgi:hypothetical protein